MPPRAMRVARSGTEIAPVAAAAVRTARANSATGAQYRMANAPWYQVATNRNTDRAAVGIQSKVRSMPLWGGASSCEPGMVTCMRFLGIASLLSLILALAPAGAAAQSHAAPSDPDADSPSGVVYELPLDQARKDAAPRKGGGKGNGKKGSSGNGSSGQGSDPARSDTAIRSENNFGSSSQVPGVSGGGSEDQDDDDRSGGTAGEAPPAVGRKRRSGPARARPRRSPRARRPAPSEQRAFRQRRAPAGRLSAAVGGAIGIIAGRRSRTLRRRDI